MSSDRMRSHGRDPLAREGLHLNLKMNGPLLQWWRTPRGKWRWCSRNIR